MIVLLLLLVLYHMFASELLKKTGWCSICYGNRGRRVLNMIYKLTISRIYCPLIIWNFVETKQSTSLGSLKKHAKLYASNDKSSSQNNLNYVQFDFISIEDIIKSDCEQSDGSFTFCCKIFCQVKKDKHHAVPRSRPRDLAADLEKHCS